MTFRLYYEQTEGTPIWELATVVNVTKGIFKFGLGPLDLPFETVYWLGISVEGEAELTPRIPLVSSPYALNARTVEDSAITTNKIADQAVNAAKIADGQVVRALNGLMDEVNLVPGANIAIDPMGQNIIISATGGGSGVSGSGQSGQVAFWDGTSSISGDNWLFWDSVNRRLGVGTPGPNARLRVESDEQFTGLFASTYQSDTTEVIRANYLGGGDVNATAVKGISKPAGGYGIGGNFTGGSKGLIATGIGGDTGTVEGMQSTVRPPLQAIPITPDTSTGISSTQDRSTSSRTGCSKRIFSRAMALSIRFLHSSRKSTRMPVLDAQVSPSRAASTTASSRRRSRRSFPNWSAISTIPASPL